MQKYEPTWNSLKRHKLPEWLDDAKFGIYFHWGPYSVPVYGSEWYPNKMYNKITGIYKHHVKTYGDPSEFGYKDFIPMFTAEKFNADDWAKLFKEAGAKFAGLVAEHHDGFSMWNSKINKWNAANMGPKRDIVGEMEKAIHKQGLKFITTFHHANNWYYYNHNLKYDTSDPQYSGLYGLLHSPPNKGFSNPSTDRPCKEFCDIWLTKLKEVIDNYRPDLIWFDFGLKWIPDLYKRQMAAYYYNNALEWDKEVEIIFKHHDLPPGIGLVDYERGRSKKLTDFKWITDTFVGTKSWSYVENEVYKPTEMLIHNFADRIAKNGLLLMNFGPKADGAIPDEVRQRFKEIGDWVKLNEEAIFNSTPWVLAEEGPTKLRINGGFSEKLEVHYKARDLRFVTKDNALYIFSLGIPKKELIVKSLTKSPKRLRKIRHFIKKFYLIEENDIKSVHLLGFENELNWNLTDHGLIIKIPDKKPCNYSYVFKISWN